jgi:aromatic ring-opening dioxygenase catalytic subunit (LigB family)
MATYFRKRVEIDLSNTKKLLLGRTLLTKVGKELALIAGGNPIHEYFELIIKRLEAVKMKPKLVL